MRKILCLIILFSGIFVSCEKEDYKLYDVTQQGKVFIRYDKYETDSVHIDYGFSSATKYVFHLPVRLMGVPVAIDRCFGLEAIPDSTTAVAGVHYDIVDSTLVMPKDSIEAKVKIVFYRDRDPELSEKQLVLALRLVATDELQPVGQIDFKITYQDVVLDAPSWWWANLLGPYSYKLAQKFFDYYHAMEEKNSYAYQLLVKQNGEYFETAPNYVLMDYYLGPVYKKYIVMPLYEYYQLHPEPGINVPKPSM